MVTQPTTISSGYLVTNVSCAGAADGSIDLTVSGGTAPYAYLWLDNAATTEDRSGLAAGSYTVQITDANGCVTSVTIVVTEPAALTATASGVNASCGNLNGSVTTTATGGTAPYGYLWSTGQATQTAAGLDAGTYTVTVTDAHGCTTTAQATITQGGAVSCSITFTQPSCSGYGNGTATVTALGGNAIYTYSWNTAPIQTTITATGLAAGTYEVVVTDGTGCTSTCNIDITEPDAMSISTTQTNNNCYGTSLGEATVSVSGGTSPYAYLWSDGQTTATATGLAAGMYLVTVTDANGCSITGGVIITQPAAMTCNTSSTPASCGQANGTATTNVFGGTAPYSYSWSTTPIQVNAIATNLTAGNYTVVITDAGGCTTSCSANVNQPGSM